MEVAERGILVKLMLHEEFSTEKAFDEEILKNYIIGSGLSSNSKRSIGKVITYMLNKKHLARVKPNGFRVKYRRGEKAAPKLGFPKVGVPVSVDEVRDLRRSSEQIRTFLGRLEEELKLLRR